MAICPTTVCCPLEYCARIWPPFPTPTWTSCAAADPSCATADVDDGWAYWVTRGAVPLYRFQFTDMSAALSANPEITSGAGGAVLDESEPSELNVSVPVRGVKGGFCMSASGT